VETTKLQETTRLFVGKLLQIIKAVLYPLSLCLWLVWRIKNCRETHSKVGVGQMAVRRCQNRNKLLVNFGSNCVCIGPARLRCSRC
jgi:hypothetical protein